MSAKISYCTYYWCQGHELDDDDIPEADPCPRCGSETFGSDVCPHCEDEYEKTLPCPICDVVGGHAPDCETQQ